MSRFAPARVVSALILFAVAYTGPAHAQSAAPLKVAYLPCGRINDQSWSQAGYEGVLAATAGSTSATAIASMMPNAVTTWIAGSGSCVTELR
jgi:basic membrane lipoprotein Med (substrate-binding protein (PBP1-ABC) superfamily)